MKPFDFIAPTTLEEALAALEEGRDGARLIAGGQSLLLEMKDRRATPSRLVSLAALPELGRWFYAESGELVIGASTSYATLSAAALPGWHGVVAAVAGDLADEPVRTMGTIGGGLCQADPRFDMLTLAVGLDVRLELASVRGRRMVPAAELFPTAGGIDLLPAEILTAIRLPAEERYGGAAFEKVRHRMFDAAIASAVCALRLDPDGQVSEARLTIGALSPAPIVLAGPASALVGHAPNAGHLVDVGAAATEMVAAVVPSNTRQQRYQRELAGIVVCRAIARALDQARS